MFGLLDTTDKEVVPLTLNEPNVPTLVIFGWDAVDNVPDKVVALTVPLTSNATDGLVKPIPTRLFDASTTNVVESTVKFPRIVVAPLTSNATPEGDLPIPTFPLS